MAVVRKCDRCGKNYEVIDRYGLDPLKVSESEHYKYQVFVKEPGLLPKQLDLCEECREKLADFLNLKDEKEELEEKATILKRDVTNEEWFNQLVRGTSSAQTIIE